jgi:hypothetical protein
MLAELAACNAAFGVIKQAVANGKSIADCGEFVANFVNGKADLEKKLHKKRNSLFSGSADHDLEEFMALEKIKQNEQELKEFMMLYGRNHLWDDWLRFQADQRKRRQEEEKKRKKRVHDIVVGTLVTVLIILGLFVLAGVVALIYYSQN